MSFFSTGNSGSGAARSSSVRISVCGMGMLLATFSRPAAA
jgi:hypothetical protein